ncbi:MAG TPA: heme lyase CcmF/NrfE family subunit [Quisquiliibacterium sp.]|nr:heme lyase CcmF/NrfE family subunit [Quisquiliibacterium sp.]HQN13465.1 heme lyase CcmF/NrfE family subunit [Quisquiliibacterium sp.]HQP65862.1 heme lyase CcmF/NrfE family subunit [Quisquiliibacterium sp.]
MTAEIGHFALILALPLTLVFGVLSLVGAWRRDARLMAVAAPAATGAFALVVLAFACLIALFVGNEFTVQLVAQHSNRNLPLAYRVAASWGSHEGSMLLWVLMLAGWTAAVALLSGQLPATLRARVLGTMGLIGFGFLLFLLFTSNPFERLVPAAAEGRDLNPLLQDPGMVFHPPLLYMGYVGFAVAFAFAIAGLLEGRFDAAWARWARPWTTVAWSFLTLGICLGSFWAYYELGWGGWWFWDPVENASFMPWLAGTALIHSLSVTEKRGAFRSWTVLLAILAFSLSLLGTFLVRSGVLTSVHAFATDPARGVFILIFLAIVIGGSLSLFAWRAPSIGTGPGFGAVSRESMLLANNILLIVAMAAVLLGTLYPLAMDTLGLGKISVGPPYFESVFFPLMAPALFLLGIGPIARWRKAELPQIAHRLKWAMAVAVVVALLLPLTIDGFRPLTSLGLLLSCWIVASAVTVVLDGLRGADGRVALSRMRLMSPSLWGMHLAHVGVAAFVFGVTMVNSYETEIDGRVEVGQAITVDGYSVRLDRLTDVKGPNYDAVRGVFTLSHNGQVLSVLHPEKRLYRSNGQPMTEAAIDRSLARDVYVSMGEPLGGNAWAVRVHVKPWVNWIWLGCVLMGAGGILAASDRRYRRAARADVASRAAVANA